MNAVNYTYSPIHKSNKAKNLITSLPLFSSSYKKRILKPMKTILFWIQAFFLRLFIKQLGVLYSPFKSSVINEGDNVFV